MLPLLVWRRGSLPQPPTHDPSKGAVMTVTAASAILPLPVPRPPLQPAISHLVSSIHAPSVTLSNRDGRLTGQGAEGFFLGERRLLSLFTLDVYSRAPEVVHSVLGPDGRLRITAMIRDGSEDTPDPVLLMRLTRSQNHDGFIDTVTIENLGTRARQMPIQLWLGSDLAPTSKIKAGLVPHTVLAPSDRDGGICFDRDGYCVTVNAIPGGVVDLVSPALHWHPIVDAHSEWSVTINVRGTQPDDGAFRPLPATRILWSEPSVVTDDVALAQLVDWSFGDLRRLALADPADPNDTFIAAGCPWYFTLFGRDSLWTARMMMPFGTELAASTLRALARRQGTRNDPDAAEQPGRIPHELRPATLEEGLMSLPPVYYGSVDSTPLWITTLGEAWRWGLSDADVVPMLDALQAAVDWLINDGDADDDGLCEYIDSTGTGLSNQGWKDSSDSVHWHGGALAAAPLALVEVQGYAYEAATNAAFLYEHFGLSGGDRIAAFATRLKTVFHQKFWLNDAAGPHLAIALDASKHAVDSTTSNPGHVLGTGLLSPSQETLVVQRLLSQLDCGVGLRTLSVGDYRYNPLSYHNGSIWPHDTAICARGMIMAGHPEAAGILVAGLMKAATEFDGRLPELFASIDDQAPIVAYPASCRPQAWAAAVGPLALWATAPLLPSQPGQPPRQLRGINQTGTSSIRGFRFFAQSFDALIVDGKVTFTDGFAVN